MGRNAKIYRTIDRINYSVKIISDKCRNVLVTKPSRKSRVDEDLILPPRFTPKTVVILLRLSEAT